eukprot:Skav231218  [mRNA]  locus=scaffold2958:270339:276319:- [translate_table: standard]
MSTPVAFIINLCFGISTGSAKDGQLGSRTACSGHGECTVHGECRCDSHHAGPACEHSKTEILHNDHFDFQLASGQYQYFRVHIPPKFPGGYVEVQVQASNPVVVLMRYDDLPTKSAYEVSNFDDWIERSHWAADHGEIMANGRRMVEAS